MPDEHGHFSCFIKATDERPFRHLGALSLLPHRVAGYHRVRHRVSRWLGSGRHTGYFQIDSSNTCNTSTTPRSATSMRTVLRGQQPIFEFWERSGKDALGLAPARRREHRAHAPRDRARRRRARLPVPRPAGRDHAPARDEAGGRRRLRQARSRPALAPRARAEALPGCPLPRLQRPRDVRYRGGLRPLASVAAFRHARYGRDYVAVWDSTMARFWFEDERVREEARQFLTEAQDGGRIVSHEELARWRCNFPGTKIRRDDLPAAAGVDPAPSFMNQCWVNGMHGYEPEHEECDASWITNA